MSVIINGTEKKSFYCNDTFIKKIVFNGTIVYNKNVTIVYTCSDYTTGLYTYIKVEAYVSSASTSGISDPITVDIYGYENDSSSVISTTPITMELNSSNSFNNSTEWKVYLRSLMLGTCEPAQIKFTYMSQTVTAVIDYRSINSAPSGSSYSQWYMGKIST